MKVTENNEIYSRVSQSEGQRKEAFMVYYKNYINIHMYKRDRETYIKTLGKVESLLKDVADVNRNILVISTNNIDREVFLTLFSKKERFTTNRYVNAPQVYDVFWDKCGKDNVRLDDDEVMYSTQNYNEDVLCISMSADQYVHGVGPILNSVIDSRRNRMNVRGESLITWMFYRGTVAEMSEDRDYKMPLNYFKSQGDDFIIIDMNQMSGGIWTTNQTGQKETTLGDIY